MSSLLRFLDYQPEIKGRKLFAPLSFSLNTKDVVILRGPSGSGKTTLIEDIVYKRTDKIQVTDSFSFMPQSLDLVKNRLVIENVLLPEMIKKNRFNFWQKPELETTQKAQALLVELGLSKPHQLVLNMSGGEQQRAALCRTLLCEEKLWILDEPISQLDPEISQKCFEIILKKIEEKNSGALLVLHQSVQIPNSNLNIKTLTWDQKWHWS